ncbi:hypothetical protein Lokhon_01859 [Limimaricola hongkongensis DSM 17492]|uniref:FtsK gamma domain-containing protein n=2 Tax=Limimaricola hongkongensis TaxID=278132 RepID=A0A017HDB4_9RHOB|nr:hypothetical protein Lokhon_01859 [Limimaricola hongkongensis DSM 17492]
MNEQTAIPIPSEADVIAAAVVDPMIRSAAAYVIRTGKVSVKGIREACMVGPYRAGEIIASLEALGVVGPADRTEKRLVLLDALPPALDPKAAKARMKETPEDVAVRTNAENAAGEELRQFIERVEHLEAEKKDIAEQIKEVMAEAKGRGYDTKILRKVIALRKRDADDIAEGEAVLDMYKAALGMS